MKIIDIYRKFNVPPNLQEHMLRVCSIVNFLEKHWKGKASVDWNLIKTAALLHDLGNIVKFNLDKHPEFLGSEEKNTKFWKKVQANIIKRYGVEDHEATRKMLSEIKVDKKIITLTLSKGFASSIQTSKSANWSVKILFYADLRTLPFGIGSLEERISDARGRMPKYTKMPNFEELVTSCRLIERQVQDNLDIFVDEINDKNIKIDKNPLNLEV